MFPGASGGYEGGGSESYPDMGGMEGMGEEEDGGSGGNTVGGDMPIPESSGTASPASSGSTGGAMPSGMPSGMGGTGAMRFTGDPADGRYVDNNYTPLRASRIRQAMKASNPADAFLVVAKRMPIRLRLVVDQRKLHRLLAECGNSLLPVEIRQVRLNRGKSSGAGGGGYDMGGGSGMGDPTGMEGGGSLSGAMGLGGPGMGMGEGPYDDGSMGEESDVGSGQSMYPGGMGGLGPSFGDMAGRSRVSSTTSHDVPVELYGIIYIYNPPDRDRLGIEQTQEGLTGAVQPDTTAPG